MSTLPPPPRRQPQSQGVSFEMKQDLFQNLPSETVIDILSRLPVRTIISCKCVHKSWLHLVETREFVKSHLSKSAPGLTICETLLPKGPNMFKFFEFEDGVDVEHHDLHYKLVTKFNHANFGNADGPVELMGSVDGLLLLCKLSASNSKPNALHICNPITRHYISLPPCPLNPFSQSATYGFGLSKVTGQYKVVMVFRDRKNLQETRDCQTSEAGCYVYTLGTGSWRWLASCPLLLHGGQSTGLFLNGNLHWVAFDVGKGSFLPKISCFDLETEEFSALSGPSAWNRQFEIVGRMSLFTLGDCLGFCYNTSSHDILIWLMKEYGDEKSWSNEFVLRNSFEFYGFNLGAYPIKIFKDGDILLKWNGMFIYYSSRTKTSHKVDTFEKPQKCYSNSIRHTPSFVSLESFGLDVSSF